MTYTRRLLILLAFATGLMQACATNPVTGRQDFVLMSEAEEISLGRRYNQDILKEQPAYPDPALAEYVDRVGQTLARASHRPGLSYHFTVVDSPDVNAFALPGGYIYITRGLLAYLNSEAELAAVLGHELGHVTARHSVRQYSAAAATGVLGSVLSAAVGIQGSRDLFNMLGKALLSGYGREHELEADRLGAEYLARTGYDPDAMLKVIGILKNQELFERRRAREEGRRPRIYHGVFASHPDNDRRLQEVVAQAGRLTTTAGRIGHDAFLNRLEGLVFGDGERDGVRHGNRFLHKPLDFGLDFPPDWQIENFAERLVGVAPGGEALLEIRVRPVEAGTPPRRFLEQLGLRSLRDGAPLQVNGFQAYTATASITTNIGRRTARIAVVYDSGNAFVFTGISRSGRDQRRFDDAFLSVARSYHKLSEEEKRIAEGHRLHLITATADTRFSALAKQSPIGRYAEDQLRLLNDLYPDGEPAPGQRIKIVR